MSKKTNSPETINVPESATLTTGELQAGYILTGSPPIKEISTIDQFKAILEQAYDVAEVCLQNNAWDQQKKILGSLYDPVIKLSKIRHAARGIAITLAAYKLANPAQDIRLHKSEFPGGFSARAIDSAGTVPFLQAHSLYYNVETHWLSQTFSFAGPYLPDLDLKTQPKAAGPLMIEVVNAIQTSETPELTARAALEVLLGTLIAQRNQGKVPLEKPKNLSIDQTVALLRQHFYFGYSKNRPRLPQVAVYALYEIITRTIERYKDLDLGPLERMKAANRKSGSVGDVDVNKSGDPFEAVEIKFDVGINRTHVAEAIQKIKTASVQRYLILSTVGVAAGEEEAIADLTTGFRRSNGCELIVNGVLETVKYYLRLLDSPASFINHYTALVEVDPDLDYEHRLAWNEICAKRAVP